ncbi:MAG: cupin domain-containing protein [Bacillota bacterium]|nr:cupin domain-containing protein [Bacillota bacterium]
MIAANEKDIKVINLKSDEYQNVKAKVLISPETGSKENVLRLFEVGEGGYSADHKHDFPHYVYVLEGEGVLHLDVKDYEICQGSFSFIPPNIQHQLVNTTKEGKKLRFLCMVPVEGHIGF